MLRARIVERIAAEDQDIDVRKGMQLAAAVAADCHQRDSGQGVEAVKAPQAAQQAVDKQGARVNQHFCRFAGVKRRGEKGVKGFQLLLQGVAGQHRVIPVRRGVFQAVNDLIRQDSAHTASLFLSHKKTGAGPAFYQWGTITLR